MSRARRGQLRSRIPGWLAVGLLLFRGQFRAPASSGRDDEAGGATRRTSQGEARAGRARQELTSGKRARSVAFTWQGHCSSLGEEDPRPLGVCQVEAVWAQNETSPIPS